MPATYNFTGKRAAKRAANLQKTFTWLDSTGTAVNNTGMTGEMQVRTAPGVEPPILTLTGEITAGGTNGQIILDVPADTMEVGSESAVTSAVYDLYMIDGSTRICVLEGDFEIVPNVTEF